MVRPPLIDLTDNENARNQGVERVDQEPRHPIGTVEHASDFETVHELQRALFVDLARQVERVDHHANVQEDDAKGGPHCF